MKSIKTAAMAALLCTSFITSPALADTVPAPTAAAADAATLAAMQAQCDAAAALHGPSTGDNDHYTGEVVEGLTSPVTGPNEVAGTRDIDESSIATIGTYVPSQLEIRGNPFKNGGSVNMFGDQWSTAGYFPDSTYNFSADFNSTFSHAFSCNVNEAIYHPPVHHDAVYHPVEGSYINWDFGHGQGNDNGTGGDPSDVPQGSCAAHNATGPTFGQWGQDTEQCKFIVTQAAFTDPAYDDDPYWDEATTIESVAGTPVNQDQTDALNGFEDHGGIVYTTGEYHVGQPVICISPGNKGGSWRAQNGYSGGSSTGPAPGCNTPYFKIAPTGNGTTTSNGTFNSVPNYNY